MMLDVPHVGLQYFGNRIIRASGIAIHFFDFSSVSFEINCWLSLLVACK
jgi:hypothetical protein